MLLSANVDNYVNDRRYQKIPGTISLKVWLDTITKMKGINSHAWSSSVVSVLTLMLGLLATALAIDCYKCTSINGMAEDCEDAFEPDMTTVHLIERECFYGLFKGTHCIKFKGEKEDGTTVLVRDCSNSDWGSHCGDIRYLYGEKEQMINGCLDACHHDGCNKATFHKQSYFLVIPIVAVILILKHMINYGRLLS